MEQIGFGFTGRRAESLGRKWVAKKGHHWQTRRIIGAQTQWDAKNEKKDNITETQMTSWTTFIDIYYA